MQWRFDWFSWPLHATYSWLFPVGIGFLNSESEVDIISYTGTWQGRIAEVEFTTAAVQPKVAVSMSGGTERGIRYSIS